MSDDWKVVEPTSADYAAMEQPDKIRVSDFAQGKIISTVADESDVREVEIYKTSRTQIKATYISNNKRIVELKITKYPIQNGVLQTPTEIRIDTNNTSTLTQFLQFLLGAELSSVLAGRLSFEQNIMLDPALEAKLKVLVNDPSGKIQLTKLFEEGYLTSELDIPELIKKGLSKQKIDEKHDRIKELEILISKPDVREVSEIQAFLKLNPWIFGPEYKDLDFRDAGFSGNPDGRLLRIDGLSDILEVKLPTEELLRADNVYRQFLSPKLAEALGQITGYLEYYYSEYSHERNDTTGEEILEDRLGKYYKPKGILLIGRRGLELVNSTSQTIAAEPKYMRRLLSYYHWIEVLTYDDLIERAKNGLDNLSL